MRRGEHGLVEMRLCRGTTSDDLPLRIRVEDGRLYILLFNGYSVLVGDRKKPMFTMSATAVCTLKVLPFEKADYARFSGVDVPDVALEVAVPDRYRFIPRRPGFGLRPITVGSESAGSVGPSRRSGTRSSTWHAPFNPKKSRFTSRKLCAPSPCFFFC